MAPTGYSPIAQRGFGLEEGADADGLALCAGPSPMTTAGLLSRATFSWLDPLLRTGAAKQKLALEDIYALPPSFESMRILEEFNTAWQRRTNEGASASRRPVWQLIGTMWDMFSGVYLGAMALKFASDMFKFMGPLSLQALLRWLGNAEAEPPVWAAFVPTTYRGYYFVLVMSLASFLDYLCLAHTYSVGNGLGIRLRSTVILAVYQKSLQQSNAAQAETTTGKVVNLMSSDANRMQARY